jgi:hypothetical protein
MDQNKLPFDPRHLGGPSGVAKNIFRAHGAFGAIVQLSCAKVNNISKWTEASFHLTHII